MLRLVGSRFDVLAQTRHEVIDGAGVGIFADVPDFLEQPFSRVRLTVMADEVPQQIGFHQRQRMHLGADPKFLGGEDNRLAGERKFVWWRRGQLPALSPQHHTSLLSVSKQTATSISPSDTFVHVSPLSVLRAILDTSRKPKSQVPSVAPAIVVGLGYRFSK